MLTRYTKQHLFSWTYRCTHDYCLPDRRVTAEDGLSSKICCSSLLACWMEALALDMPIRPTTPHVHAGMESLNCWLRSSSLVSKSPTLFRFACSLDLVCPQASRAHTSVQQRDHYLSCQGKRSQRSHRVAPYRSPSCTLVGHDSQAHSQHRATTTQASDQASHQNNKPGISLSNSISIDSQSPLPYPPRRNQTLDIAYHSKLTITAYVSVNRRGCLAVVIPPSRATDQSEAPNTGFSNAW